MLSTELIQRATEDIEFKQLNIDKLQDEIVLIDDQKSLYDQGIFSLEEELLNELEGITKQLGGNITKLTRANSTGRMSKIIEIEYNIIDQ